MGSAEARRRGAYSVPSSATPYLRIGNRETQPVDYTVPKQSPRYTQPQTMKDDPAGSIWIKARRGSPRAPSRQSGPQEDIWAKAMRGSSPDAQAQRKLQISSMQRRSVPPTQGANDEVKAGSDLEYDQYVQAQVKTLLHHAHTCIDF